MKSFKQMMAEVAQPESEEEKAFKAQHKVVVNKHPVALDHQHTGEIAKPKAKRKADQEGDAAYDMAYESIAKLDELSKKTLGNYVKKSAADMSSKDSLDMHKGAMKRYKGIVKATDRLAKESTDLTENPQEEIPMMMNQLAFICYAAEEMSGMMKLGGDPEEWFQNKLAAVHGEMKSLYSYMQGESQMGESTMAKRDALDKASAPSKEGKKAVTLKKAPWDKNEELSPKQKKIDHNKNGKIDGQDLAMIRAKKNEASCGTSKKSYKEEAELDEAAHSEWHVDFKSDGHKPQKVKARNTAEAIKKASKKAQAAHPQPSQIPMHKSVKKVTEEVEELDEVSQKTLWNYHAKAGADLQKKREKLDKGTLTTKDLKKGQNRVKGLNRAADKMHEEAELDETTNSAVKKPITMTGPDGKTRTVMKTTKANVTDDNGQDKIKTNESLDEAFKQGIVKLKDGSSMVLKKEDADVINKMFKAMSSGSVKKMTETAMKDKKGFAEILDFAKEAM